MIIIIIINKNYNIITTKLVRYNCISIENKTQKIRRKLTVLVTQVRLRQQLERASPISNGFYPE